jgi:hypothetical protein
MSACSAGASVNGMRLATGPIAAASARHPWQVVGAWSAAVVLAIVVIVVFLGGSLTTKGSPTNNPESDRADKARHAVFPPDPSRAVTDVVVIRSDEYTVNSPRFKAYVQDFVTDAEIPALGRAHTYLAHGNEGLVSADHHATMVPLALTDDETEALVNRVESADEQGPFTVSVTGDKTVDNDFDTLSQQDLQNGELKFGLPAALLILLLVFGAVVAGLMPLMMAIVSIVIALGDDRAGRAGVRALGLRDQHAHGHGSRARDRLFALRRLPIPGGARPGEGQAGGDRGGRRYGEPCRAVQRQCVRRRHARDVARPELDHA